MIDYHEGTGKGGKEGTPEIFTNNNPALNVDYSAQSQRMDDLVEQMQITGV